MVDAKVYLVFDRQSYEDLVVVGAFSSKEKAQKWIDSLPPDKARGWPQYERPGCLSIEEWNLDDL